MNFGLGVECDLYCLSERQVVRYHCSYVSRPFEYSNIYFGVLSISAKKAPLTLQNIKLVV